MGVELPLRVVVTILECCVTFSGVKLSIRSVVLFIDFHGLSFGSSGKALDKVHLPPNQIISVVG